MLFHFHVMCYSSEAYYDVDVWEFVSLNFGLYIRPVCLPAGPRHDQDAYVRDAAETMGKSCTTAQHRHSNGAVL